MAKGGGEGNRPTTAALTVTSLAKKRGRNLLKIAAGLVVSVAKITVGRNGSRCFYESIWRAEEAGKSGRRTGKGSVVAKAQRGGVEEEKAGNNTNTHT